MQPQATLINSAPISLPRMDLMRPREIFVVFGIKVDGKFVWIGVDTLDRAFTFKEPMKNTLYATEFSGGQYVLDCDVLQFHKGHHAVHVARSEAFKLVTLHKPYCNVHGRPEGRARPIRCIESGEIFKNASDAARKCNVNQSNLSKHLSRQTSINTVGGLTFEYTSIDSYNEQERHRQPLTAKFNPDTNRPEPLTRTQQAFNETGVLVEMPEIPPRPGFMYDMYGKEVSFIAKQTPQSGMVFDWEGFPRWPSEYEDGTKRRHPWQPAPGSYPIRAAAPTPAPAPVAPPVAAPHPLWPKPAPVPAAPAGDDVGGVPDAAVTHPDWQAQVIDTDDD